MLYLALLILLALFLYIRLKNILDKEFLKIQNNYILLKKEYEGTIQEDTKLKADNAVLERSTEENIALYDITKDICKTLDEDKILAIFREHLSKYIKTGDCKFLKSDADISLYDNSNVLPLAINKQSLGYLIVDDIKGEDRDRFHILANQFLSGLKRALLYKRVQELTIIDSLTQVFNRRYFLERFYEELKRSKKFKLHFCFLMVDIDHFKNYNDNYGHLVGDAILRELTKTIKETIRQVDFIGRYGGEELSIILTETDKEQAHFAAERIRQAIESKQIKVYDEDLKVTVSIGVSTFPDDGNDTRRLIERSDEALYTAKQAGRNRTYIWTAKG